MKHLVFIFLIVLSPLFLLSQEKGETSVLLQNAKENIYSNPGQSLRISEQILNTSTSNNELKFAHLIASKSYFVKGEYKSAIENYFLGDAIEQGDNYQQLTIEYLIHGISLFKFLGYDELTNQLQAEAEHQLKSLNNKSQFELYENHLSYLKLDSLNDESALLNLLNKIDLSNQTQKSSSLILKSKIEKDLANSMLLKGSLETSKSYFEAALKNVKLIENGYFFGMQILIDYAHSFFQTANHEAAIEYLNEAIVLSENFNNSYYEYKIYEQLTQNYLAIENSEKFLEYNTISNNTANMLTNKKSIATNALFNILQNNHITQKSQLEQKHKNWSLYLVLLILILGSVWVLVKWFFTINLKHSQDIINYLKLIDEIDKKEVINKKQEIKSLGIPKETEELILQKLEKFEMGNKYTSKEMSLAQMAALFETNTKYLSEIINRHKGKNFNLYINSLRIKYIVKKLKSDTNYLNYKVSYLADECGFSSHSSFTTVFKNITGISPNVFIELLKKDRSNNLKISA